MYRCSVLCPVLSPLFSASGLWKDKPCVVIVIRRPGCPFCREEVAEYNKSKPLIDRMGIDSAAIILEHLGGKEFQEKFFPNGKVYVDEKRDFYKALHGGKLEKGGLKDVFGSGFWKAIKRAKVNGTKENGLKGDMKGEGRIYGGTYLIQNGEVVYEFSQHSFTSYAPIKDILKAAQGVAPNKGAVSEEEITEAIAASDSRKEAAAKGKKVTEEPVACPIDQKETLVDTNGVKPYEIPEITTTPATPMDTTAPIKVA